MFKNISRNQRIMRLIIGIFFLILSFLFNIFIGILLFILAIILISTALTGFCPLFVIFKFKKKDNMINKISEDDIKKSVRNEMSKDLSTQIKMIKPEKLHSKKYKIKSKTKKN